MQFPGGLKPSLNAKERPAEPKTYIMKLENHPTQKGVRFTGAYGKVNQKGHHFLIENLSIFEPIDIGILIDDPSRPVTLELYKYRFDQPLLTARTDKTGTLLTRIYTQGDLRIRVRAVKNDVVAYKLAVRVGKEEVPELLKSFIEIKQKSPSGNASKNGHLKIPLIIGGILAILFVFGGVILFFLIYSIKKNK